MIQKILEFQKLISWKILKDLYWGFPKLINFIRFEIIGKSHESWLEYEFAQLQRNSPLETNRMDWTKAIASFKTFNFYDKQEMVSANWWFWWKFWCCWYDRDWNSKNYRSLNLTFYVFHKRAWSCGGRIHICPCSIVGQIALKRSVIRKPKQKRIAQLWLGSYFKFFSESTTSNASLPPSIPVDFETEQGFEYRSEFLSKHIWN